MAFEIMGKLIAKFDTIQRNENFKTREFVVETNDEVNGRTFTNYIKFQCVQERTNIPDRCNIGDDVKVQFNIRGSKWEKEGRTNYITNLDAWRMETVKLNESVHEPSYTDASPSDDVDDLPF